jgi:uncharacterized membrane protein
MAFCAGCGAEVAHGVAFCPKCGRPVSAAPSGGQPAPAQHNQAAAGGTGMEENVAGALCYALGWVSGLIFLFVDKRPSVRFHAAQSIATFGLLSVLYWVFWEFVFPNIFGSMFFTGGWSLWYTLFRLLELGAAILWVFLMVKAYQGQRFRVPIAANLADSIVGKVQA